MLPLSVSTRQELYPFPHQWDTGGLHQVFLCSGFLKIVSKGNTLYKGFYVCFLL